MSHLAGQFALALGCLLAAAGPVAAKDTAMAHPPIRLHPRNPHYFLFRGRPTVLITSGEHYGAVLNRDFDYRKYLATLGKLGFNHTRTFSGCYCEPAGAFKIQKNTLAPAKGKLIGPWARSETPGYANGGNKFDLATWDPAYFRRLRGFLSEASKRGVVVELVLFCPFYREEMWRLSPMYAANNVNGIGAVQRTSVYTLRSRKLLAVQEAMVRKIAAELRDFDNLYYEICNEPYAGGGKLTTPAWERHMTDVLADAERSSRHKHLISWNIANRKKRVVKPHPAVSILNFHYAAPPETVAMNYGLNRVVGDNETGFRGMAAEPYRKEGWDFLLAGGALFSNLDYTFFVGHEDGTCRNKAPGAVSRDLHKQLGVLAAFLRSFDFVRMRPDSSVIAGGVPAKATARALAEAGKQYAIYVNGGRRADLVLEFPSGTYRAEWVDTKTGRTSKAERFRHDGGTRTVRSPAYEADIALRIVRARGR
jgi:hypothetical protein